MGSAERFEFRAPHPASSPFALEGTAREGLPVQSVTVRWWWEDDDGNVTKVTFRSNSFSFGDIDVSLTASPRSEMARFFGTKTPRESTVFTSLGGIQWASGDLLGKELFTVS